MTKYKIDLNKEDISRIIENKYSYKNIYFKYLNCKKDHTLYEERYRHLGSMETILCEYKVIQYGEKIDYPTYEYEEVYFSLLRLKSIRKKVYKTQNHQEFIESLFLKFLNFI